MYEYALGESLDRLFSSDSGIAHTKQKPAHALRAANDATRELLKSMITTMGLDRLTSDSFVNSWNLLHNIFATSDLCVSCSIPQSASATTMHY